MAAVKEFTLPDLGEGLTEAEIVRWLVEVGDVVAVDQPVVEVETAKALVEVPCPYGGVVTARFGEPGDEIPVGSPLVTVAVGEPADGSGSAEPGSGSGSGSGSASGSAAVNGASVPSSGSAGGDSGSGRVLVGYGTAAPAAVRRRRVRQSPRCERWRRRASYPEARAARMSCPPASLRRSSRSPRSGAVAPAAGTGWTRSARPRQPAAARRSPLPRTPGIRSTSATGRPWRCARRRDAP